MKQYKTSHTFTNDSDQHMLVGNCADVILIGTEAECEAKMRTIDIAASRWSFVQIVGPGKSIASSLLHPTDVGSGTSDWSGLYAQ